MNNTPWKYSIEFINTLKDDEVFETSNMLNYVRKKKPKVSASTLSKHRIILYRLGFLDRINKSNYIFAYIKKKSFIYDVGFQEAKMVAYPKYGWEQWFIPPGWKILDKYKEDN